MLTEMAAQRADAVRCARIPGMIDAQMLFSLNRQAGIIAPQIDRIATAPLSLATD